MISILPPFGGCRRGQGPMSLDEVLPASVQAMRATFLGLPARSS